MGDTISRDTGKRIIPTELQVSLIKICSNVVLASLFAGSYPFWYDFYVLGHEPMCLVFYLL